ALNDFSGDEEFKNGIAGLLHFLRALFFHNVARVYAYDPTSKGSSDCGTVPLNLKPAFRFDKIENLTRASSEELYRQLYDDLEKAYEPLSSTPNSRAPHFVTQGAVAAFFTRVALYNGDYEKVIEEAEKAIASGVGKFSTRESYVSDWRAAIHPESMFEVEFKVDQNVGVNNAIRADFTNRLNEESAAVNGRGAAKVSDDLFSLYE